MGGTEGDPRFYGYARAALEPWWETDMPSPEVLRLRAKLQEKDHQYDAAIVDLIKLLDQRPRHGQAWIEVSNIYRVQGKYDEAWSACRKLSEFSEIIPATICRAPLEAVTGKAEQAYQSLTQIIPEAKTRFPSTIQWMITMQATTAYSLGKIDLAEQHFRAGLAKRPNDQHLLRAYADFLLDRDRNAEAIELVREHTADNGILLQAALSAHRAGEVKLAQHWTAQLATRFEEIRLRGGEPHGRFEARFELELNNDAQRALTIALENWDKQKEIRDSRNVLEAAVAANNPTSAGPVIAFLKRHGTQHFLLRQLVKQLEVQ